MPLENVTEAAQTPDTLSPDEYLVFLKQVELSAIYLTACQAKIQQISSDARISLQPRFIYGVQAVEDTRAFLTAQCTLQGKQGKQTPWKFSADYEIVLRFERRAPDEFFQIYADINLEFQILPYFREWVASTSARMPIAPITLPLLKPSD